MRGIAKLLFGDDASGLLDLFGEGDGNESDMAERVRRSGEWCGTTPGRGSAERAVRNVARPHGAQRRVIIRGYRAQ